MLIQNLMEVFSQVFGGFVYTPDITAWGRGEFWPSPKDFACQCSPDGKAHGDCEDFALMCRTELDKRGIDNHLVVCLTEKGACHCVCEVDGWILDCRQTSVARRDDLPYKWVMRSGTKAGEPWHRIS